MGWREAIEDGITIGKDSRNYNCYYPPCHICATPVYSWTYTQGAKYTCKDCRTELV